MTSNAIRRGLAPIVVAFFLPACATAPPKPTYQGPGAIFKAIRGRDADAVKVLLEQGADPKQRDSVGQFPLERAAFLGDTDVALVLLQGGATIRDAEENGRTALMAAALGGHLEMVQLLMDWGSDRDAGDRSGMTALDYAGRSGHSEIRDAILQRGVSRTQALTEIRHDCTKPLSPAQTWALATNAGSDELSDNTCAGLGGSDVFNSDNIKKRLEKDWKIRDHQGALDAIAKLNDEGQRKAYDEDRARTQKLGFRQLEAEVNKVARTNKKKALQIHAAWLSGSSLGPNGILAWDLCRVIWVAGHAYAAGYLTEDEAWAVILATACRIQANFKSWEEMRASYIDGRGYAYGTDHNQVEMKDVTAALLDPKNSGSPWIRIPWTQNLDCP